MKQYDAIIIGFGKGGKTLAVDLAKRNWKVAVIERSAQMYGGTCINIGCIPTKTLVHLAKWVDGRSDLSFEEKKKLYASAIATKNQVTAQLRSKNYDHLSANENIDVYTGEGSFETEKIVCVWTKTEKIELQSEHIFINTGAEPIVPPILGAKESRCLYTSTSLLELKELPAHLVIIGGGYIGLEFASIYASFGSKVTVLEGAAELIPREDRDIAACVKETLEKKGIVFRMNARVLSIADEKEGTRVSFWDMNTKQTIDIQGDAVLLATGRRPATRGLNLERAGVEVNERGAIVVDEFLKTSCPHIWALGDVKGGLQFTYISLDDYRIVREDLFGDKRRSTSDRQPVSYSVFIDPPLSHIGINEQEARKNNMDVVVRKLPVAGIPRARTLGETAGLIKTVVDAKTNKIIGCTLFCPESSEVINSVAIAMKAGQDYTFLRDFVFTHPSMSESLNELYAL